MAIAWDNLKTRPLITFFVAEQCYSYCADGMLWTWGINGNPSQSTTGKIEGVDRVIFHDSDSHKQVSDSYLLGFNVIPATPKYSSTVTWKQNSLILNALVRCFLQHYYEPTGNGPVIDPSGILGEAVGILVKLDLEGVTAFLIRHSAIIDPSDTDMVDVIAGTGQRNLKAALGQLSSGRSGPLRLGKKDAGNFTQIYTQASYLLRGLIAENPGKKALGGDSGQDLLRAIGGDTKAVLTVTFRDTGSQQSGQYLIEFGARFSRDLTRNETLNCFAIGLISDGDDPKRLFRPALGQEWVFRQRSSSKSCVMGSRADVAAATRGEWVLELRCLSQLGVKKQTERWMDAYRNGIVALGGATGGSFLPTIPAPPAVAGGNSSGLVFTALYGVNDPLRVRYYDAVLLESPSSSRLTIQPWSVLFVGNRLPQTDNQGHPSDSLEETGFLEMQFALCQATSNDALVARQELVAPPLPERESYRGFAFYSRSPLQATKSPKQTVRMGSLELEFGQRDGSQSSPSTFLLEDLGQGGELQVDATLIVTQVRPGGQDDIPEDTFLAANVAVESMPCRIGSTRDQEVQSSDATPDLQVELAFHRPRPLLINRNLTSSGDAQLKLIVDEKSAPGSNRTLRLYVDPDRAQSKSSNPQAVTSGRQQVIVLDADPFLVAQLSFPPLISQAARSAFHVATWTNADGDGAKWQIPLASTDFDLTMPSQVLGEEMVKDKNYQLPMDFRLGPPATIRMQTGYQLTNYAEVPWNLRRILGYAGQRAPGVNVDRLDYELIYGLSCDVSQPFVRLAEVFALLGAIPGRLPRTMVATDLQELLGLSSDFDHWRVRWAQIYQRYQGRLAILEPWDAHVTDSLTLKHGMSCVIRYPTSPELAKTGFSFPADLTGRLVQLPAADLDDPISPKSRASGSVAATQPLRGGVTWGFESRNIFSAVLRNQYSTKDSASVSDLDLTALGAFGHQQASFDEGRTTIFGDTAMGRTYFYKLERIGRICGYWNKAKHVIVYERSVVPSRQFYQEQNPDTLPGGASNARNSYGIPMLRKVEEYIEILDDERRFPDDHLLPIPSTTTPQVTPAQRCGCVSACVFAKGTKIHVSSAWGSDVNSNGQSLGWKVPLWKKGATPEDVYPFPKISLSIQSQFGDSTVEVPCDIANPEGIYFYTDTRKGTGSDSDSWEAIIGLDTVDLPLIPPSAKFSSTNPSVPSVADSPVPAGFSPCTVELLPPLRPANIVANRGGSPIAAVLSTVTMMRGCKPQEQLKPEAAALLKLAGDYRTAWSNFLDAITPDDWKDSTKGKLKALASTSLAFDGIKNALGTVGALGTVSQTVKDAWTKNWNGAINAYNLSSLDKLRLQILNASSDPNTVLGGVQKILQDVQVETRHVQATITDQQAKIDRLTQLVEEQFGSFQQAVLEASATPGVLTALLLQYRTAAAGVVSASPSRIKQLITEANQPVPTGQLATTVAYITKKVSSLRDELIQTWDAAGLTKPLPELADISQGLTGLSGPLEAFYTEYSRLVGLTAPLAGKTSLVTAIQNLTLDQNGLTALRNNLDHLPASFTNATNTQLDAFAKMLKVGFTSLEPSILNDGTLETSFDAFRRDVTQIVANGKNWATSAYGTLISAAATGSPDALNLAFTNLFSETSPNSFFKTQLGPLSDKLKDELRMLKTGIGSLDTALNNFTGAAGATLENLGASLSSILDQATSTEEGLKQAVLNFRDAQFAELNNYIGKNLDMVRQEAGKARDLLANTNQLISLARCFGDAPVVDTLKFVPAKLGYYLQGVPGTQVDLTPVTATLQQAGNVLATQVNNVLNNALDTMKIQLPSVSLGDHLIPPDLTNFRLADIFPRFAGLDLSNLFKGINLNEDGSKIKIQHGVDPQTRSAWAQANVGTHLEDVPVFETGGVCLRLAKADFTGVVRLDAGQAQGVTQSANGTIVGDWKLVIFGQELVTLTNAQLIFDNSGKLRFVLKPENVQLPGVMKFVTEYLSKFLGDASGLSVRIRGLEVDALMSLPIPDIQGLTSGFSNLRLACLFGVGLNNNNNFQLKVGFGLSAPDRPFNIAIFVLGGSGYIQASTTYVPGESGGPNCLVDIGIMASASLAIALGPISGGVYVFMGITASYQTGGAGANFAAVLLIRGQVNLAGIISASVSMRLSLVDEAGTLVGRGHFSISVSICWCFTLSIEMDVRYPLGSGGGQQGAHLMKGQRNEILLASLGDLGEITHFGGPAIDRALEFDLQEVPTPEDDDEQKQNAVTLRALIGDYVALTEAA